MKELLGTAALTAAFALVWACACSKDNKPAGGGAVAARSFEPPPDTVVGIWGGGKKITLAEVDQKIANQLQDMEQKKYELRLQAIESMAVDAVLEEEAKKKGITKEQYFQAEVDSKVPAPSEEEMRKFFDQVAPQLPPGASFEELKDRIARSLTGPKREALAKQLFEQLKATAAVEVKLEPPPKPRKQVEAKGPSRGPENAKVTIVEFSDFECPFCSRAHDTVEEVMQAYAGKVRLFFRHYPLPFHKKAGKAAEAASCAHEQGRFWEYHDLLFKNQQKLEVPDLKEHAKSLGLDQARFEQCLDSGKNLQTIQEDMQAGQKVGVDGTPAFFINGVMLSGAQPLEEFKKVIDQELAAH
ncbi:MAG: thioredoxin domain-containing protein [Myxococcales bacterium]|nr:thioredoxin domain-containing protein [Myxococcales bacterium]